MRHRTVALAVLTALLSLWLSPSPAHAAHLFNKLGRGAVNTTTGWLELPIRASKAKDDTAVLWLAVGVFEGVTYGLTRTLIGIWDLVTFPIPPYDSILMEPETLITEKPPRKTD